MKKRLIASLLLALLLVTNTINPTMVSASNQETTTQGTFGEYSEEIYDEVRGEYLTLNLTQLSDTQYRSQSCDSRGNVVYDYTYDETTDILTCNTDGSTEKVGLEQESSMLSSRALKPFWQKVSLSKKAIVGTVVISAALIATKLAPVLAPLCKISIAAVKTAATFTMGLVAGDIYGCISGGDWGKKVNFNIYWGGTRVEKFFDPFEGYIYVDTPYVTKINYLGIY